MASNGQLVVIKMVINADNGHSIAINDHQWQFDDLKLFAYVVLWFGAPRRLWDTMWIHTNCIRELWKALSSHMNFVISRDSIGDSGAILGSGSGRVWGGHF